MFCPSCGASADENTVFCTNCGTDVRTGTRPQSGGGPASPAPAFAPQASFPVGPAMDYAMWGTRALGYLIDGFLVCGAMVLIYAIAGGLLASMARIGGDNAAAGICCVMILLFPVATFLVGLYNRVYLVSQRGYSIGQGVVKVKVVDAYGQLLPQGTALIRLLVQAAMGLVPLLPILDLLWPLWDIRRQTLHDKAVNCYVINNPQP